MYAIILYFRDLLKREMHQQKKKMTTRTQHETIDSYEIVLIFLKSCTDFKTMTLENVTYISNFMTNLIAQNLLKRKDLCFDD
jgi:hypothetical protein